MNSRCMNGEAHRAGCPFVAPAVAVLIPVDHCKPRPFRFLALSALHGRPLDGMHVADRACRGCAGAGGAAQGLQEGPCAACRPLLPPNSPCPAPERCAAVTSSLWTLPDSLPLFRAQNVRLGRPQPRQGPAERPAPARRRSQRRRRQRRRRQPPRRRGLPQPQACDLCPSLAAGRHPGSLSSRDTPAGRLTERRGRQRRRSAAAPAAGAARGSKPSIGR